MEANRVALIGVSASLLELAGWPKPGNVHRTADFPSTRFEHFLIGAASLYSPLRKAALGDMSYGQLLMEHVTLSYSLQRGGNTHLGTAMLLIPLAHAAGEWKGGDSEDLAKNATASLALTKPSDSVWFYRAIRMSMTEKALGSVVDSDVPDVLDPEAERKLTERGLNLMDIMRASSSYDMVAREMVSGYRISLEASRFYDSYEDPNVAAVNTFLKLLSDNGDTFIARNVGEGRDIRQKVVNGLQKTEWVREEARKALLAGGIANEQGKLLVDSLDAKMRSLGLSPGSVADLLASTIFLSLICGRKI